MMENTVNRFDIYKKINLPGECATELEKAFEALDRQGKTKEIRALIIPFFEGENIEGELEKIAVNSYIHPDMIRLVFCFLCLDKTREIILSKGLGEDDFIANLLDITIWARVCLRDEGHPGMHEFEWIAKSLRGRLLRLGRMQFEIEKFKPREFTEKGVTIYRGEPVINVHIPDDGTPIPDVARFDSYKRAREFFDSDIFVFESYLLYPPQRKFLSPDSNIVHLMDDFTLIYFDENTQFRDMWRIFGGKREKWDIDTLPRGTSLQRGYADHLAKTGKCGAGYGIMIFDK